MDNIVWNRPMIVLNNIVIMPDTSSHLDVISKESCEAVANAMKGDCSILLVTAKEVKENGKVPDLYPIGVTAKIKQYTMPTGINIFALFFNRSRQISSSSSGVTSYTILHSI